MKAFLKHFLPEFGVRWAYRVVLRKSYMPPVGKINLGDLSRETPFCGRFGVKRGGCLDRRYIETFLEKEAAAIRGRVLEIGDDEYTVSFGGERVDRSDILHVNDSNPKATLVGDLSDAPQIPEGSFDCIILTQTLHLIYDFRAALVTCHRILRPGGVLLLTSPGITSIDRKGWKDIWYWSFTPQSLRRLMAETFPEGEVQVESFGNVFSAAAFLYGMGTSDVPESKMKFNDPAYPVIIAVKAVKTVRLPPQ